MPSGMSLACIGSTASIAVALLQSERSRCLLNNALRQAGRSCKAVGRYPHNCFAINQHGEEKFTLSRSPYTDEPSRALVPSISFLPASALKCLPRMTM
ncbi:hypothetical protein BU23DRAFT_235835 [Bimuria novae-zelandiae CBS 107.79]|uniref:Uncharacterized protein n=1 Tax=Bimuria novae-zelandiae CBS 107.79 TaxID=1447943 RepID=A0A6A5UXY6_9PLEO|nr:hypothetical protein BU23DRAFT_235835 [Bimuria novae-zelandiae CBS 107.79]